MLQRNTPHIAPQGSSPSASHTTPAGIIVRASMCRESRRLTLCTALYRYLLEHPTILAELYSAIATPKAYGSATEDIRGMPVLS